MSTSPSFDVVRVHNSHGNSTHLMFNGFVGVQSDFESTGHLPKVVLSRSRSVGFMPHVMMATRPNTTPASWAFLGSTTRLRKKPIPVELITQHRMMMYMVVKSMSGNASLRGR